MGLTPASGSHFSWIHRKVPPHTQTRSIPAPPWTETLSLQRGFPNTVLKQEALLSHRGPPTCEQRPHNRGTCATSRQAYWPVSASGAGLGTGTHHLRPFIYL